jgi:hypothetical protein
MSEKNVVTGPALGERQLGLLSGNGLNRSQPGTALPGSVRKVQQKDGSW